MLEAINIHKMYETGSVPLEVLRGVNLKIEPGQFLAIIGPSGAGKSTLVHMLAGLDMPTEGKVKWNGKSLSDMSETELASFRNETVGVVFQFYYLLPELTALENVMLPGLVKGSSRKIVKKQALSELDRVGLSGRVSHKPSQLSGGELQRAAIARALINEPKILCCDEPTGNLDSKTGESISKLLISLCRNQGVSLVLVTHELELAVKADQIISLRDGMMEDETNTTKKLGKIVD